MSPYPEPLTHPFLARPATLGYNAAYMPILTLSIHLS